MPTRARTRRLVIGTVALAATVLSVASQTTVASAARTGNPVLGNFKNVVVIYEENHSFDNLLGSWKNVHGVPVEGLAQAVGQNTTQVAQDGRAYGCLLLNDVNLTTPPLTSKCTQTSSSGSTAGTTFDSHFTNQPFSINPFILPTATTCPAPGVFAPNGVKDGLGLPGGCTRDLVHRFYQEQYQIDGGKQDRYVTGSDAVGLAMGTYDTTSTPIYQYLHSAGSPKYVIADHFFQAAFGGSFLNHQYLVGAKAPTYTCLDTAANCAANDLHSVVDGNGMPTSYPLYSATSSVKDAQLTQACGLPTTVAGVACGDQAINTIQPVSQPYAPGTPLYKRLQTDDSSGAGNIGDRLTQGDVSWNWYSGGWDNASGNTTGRGWTNGTDGATCADPNAFQGNYPYCPDKLFQFHHQPLNYFSNYAEGGPGRSHLQDEKNFLADVGNGTLPQVSFVKPVGEENEHPGYSSDTAGQSHLVTLLNAITSGPQAKDTLVVVTYDEFGGQWDHVTPPSLLKGAPAGTADAFGPGTRIPAILVSSGLPHNGVVKDSFDTTSILATIERGFGVAPVATRDASVADLRTALVAGGVRLPSPPVPTAH